MTTVHPVLVALALDHEADDVVRAATELAARMEVPLAAVHALPVRSRESDAELEARLRDARARVLAHLARAEDDVSACLEPVIALEQTSELVIRTAIAIDAQMIVTGGGSPPTVRRWVLGSTAEQIVRSSPVPVFLARGTRHDQGLPIVCPVDLTAQSRVGLRVAVRMARLFESRVIALHVLAPEERDVLPAELLAPEIADASAHRRLESFLGGSDLSGVSIEPLIVAGDPAQRIVEATESAWLLAIASRGFVDLVPGALGRVPERALRHGRSSAIAVRDPDAARDEREAKLRELGGYKRLAIARLAAGEAARALLLLEVVAAYAPADASLHELMADALSALGRTEEAARSRALAEVIRSSFE